VARSSAAEFCDMVLVLPTIKFYMIGQNTLWYTNTSSMDNGLITVSSRIQLVDLFTEGPLQFHDLTCTLGMIDIHSPT